MKRGTIAKTPFNYYILASQPVNNPLSLLKTSYILDILICWGFFPPSLPPRISPSLSSPSVMQVPRFYRRLQLDQIFGCGKEVPFLPCHLINKWTRVLSTPLPAIDQHDRANPWRSAAPALGCSPSYPTVFSRAAASAGPGFKGPGRLTGTWVGGLAKAGKSWEGTASGRNSREG